MTGQTSKDYGSWLNAWTEWLGPAGTGFPGWKVHPGGAEAGGLGDLAGAYSVFADAMKHFAQGKETGDLGSRLADAIERIKGAAALGDGDRLLRAFLTVAPMSPFASLFSGAAATAGGRFSDSFLDGQSQWCNWPAIGPYREWIDAEKELQGALIVRWRAERALAERYRQAVEVALACFADFLRDASGEPITSLKALYEAWIEIAEAAYVDEVMTDAFAADFATWINATSAVQMKLRGWQYRIAGLTNFPNRAEVDTLFERQKKMTREIESLRTAIDELRQARSMIDTQELPTSEAQARTKPKAHKKRSASSAQRASKSAGSRPQVARGSKRETKPATGEFDIAEILPDHD